MALSIQEINKLLTINFKPTKQQRAFVALGKFDKAALFLLELNFTNLFDPMPNTDWFFRCKGCGEVVKRTERESHHSQHRREFYGD